MSEENTPKLAFKFPKKRLAMLLYSMAGMGKSCSIATLLKIPGLKVRILALEDNCLPAIEESFAIHGITSIEEGQLTIADVTGNAITTADTFTKQSDDSVYQAAVMKLINFQGTDVATGKDVKLGNALNWGNDTILVLDGLTMLQYACATRGKAKIEEAGGNKDPRAAFYAGQDTLIGYIYQFMQRSKAHFLLLGHETSSDPEQLAKHKTLQATHPALGTRSIVSPFLGRFSVVLYAKYNKQTRQFVWSGEEPNTMTVMRNITTKGLTYKGRPVTNSNLPADFSFEGYHFFDLESDK